MTHAVSQGLLDRLRNLGSIWRDIAGAGREEVPAVQPDLPPDDADKLREQMRACLEARGGEVTARARAAALGRAYCGLSAEGRARFLGVLARDFGPEPALVDNAMARMAAASGDPVAREAAWRRMRAALEAPRRRLLTQFNALPDGVKFLVDMRAEILGLIRFDPGLAPLEADLKALLVSWFDVGFLELRRLTWRAPALVLEKIMLYEAVHAIRSWDDLKNRLDSDRRLYAYFHPRMPDEPLIFVEVALVRGIAGNVQALLDLAAPVDDPARADTAIFYSISNAQKGLAGISFGNFLIKRVVDSLAGEFKNLKTFATLSPVPGFRVWLDERLADGEPGLLTAAEHRALTKAARRRGAKGSLKTLLATPDWHRDEDLAMALEGPLVRLCARYLAEAKRDGDGRALDPVAHFHLSNGARIERVDWLGDVSPKGIAQSAGLMVNYLYKLTEIVQNHETYSGAGRVVVSPAIRALLKA